MSLFLWPDGQIRSLFDAIRQIMEPPPAKFRRIGCKAGMLKTDSQPFSAAHYRYNLCAERQLRLSVLCS